MSDDGGFGVGSGCARTSESGVSFLLFTLAKVYPCCVLWFRSKIGPSVNRRRNREQSTINLPIRLNRRPRSSKVEIQWLLKHLSG
jgi:hypothetical protein